MLTRAHVRFIIFCTFCLLASLPMTAAARDTMTAHFLDVGKGDATLLEFPCGAILVDAGGGETSGPAFDAYLDTFFQRRPDLNDRLDLVILTHGHLDHTRNIERVLSRYEVGTVLTNGHYRKRGYKGLRKALRGYPDTVLLAADAEDIPNGGLHSDRIDTLDCNGNETDAPDDTFPKITLLWGDARPQMPGWSDKYYRDENNHSVSVLVQWGDAKLLFTGDLEKRGLQAVLGRHAALLRDVDVYQISHHGFRSGTTQGFLEHINPVIAILSRPMDRAWYKPTLERFEAVIAWTRTPIEVPVWTFEPGARADEDDDMTGNSKPQNRANRANRDRAESTALLESAIYWTGLDGTIRVMLDANSDLHISTD